MGIGSPFPSSHSPILPPSPTRPNSFSSSGPGHKASGVAVGVGVGDALTGGLGGGPPPPCVGLLLDGGPDGAGLHGISLLVAAQVPGFKKVLVTPDIVHSLSLLAMQVCKKHLPLSSIR